MSIDEPTPPAAPGVSNLPWWLGSGVGLALVLVMGAVVWAGAWDIATYAATPPLPAAQRPERAEVAISPVSVTSATPTDQPPRGERRTPGTPATASASRSPREAGDRQARPASRGDVLRASAAKEREQARVRRAILAAQEEAREARERARARRAARSDRELAAFIESAGVLDEPELWGRPLRAAYRVTATFGQAGSLWSRDHTGVDLATATGTPVAAVAAGTVAAAGEAGAYGLQVKITHADGTETSYSHLSRIDVEAGDLVEQGATVGAVGSTGNSTGPHLHLELRPNGGVPVDPVKALAARGVQL